MSEKLTWIQNRLKRKYKIPPEQTKAVLSAISDLEWDWRKSVYDLYGLDVNELLQEMGKKRRPKGYKE